MPGTFPRVTPSVAMGPFGAIPGSLPLPSGTHSESSEGPVICSPASQPLELESKSVQAQLSPLLEAVLPEAPLPKAPLPKAPLPEAPLPESSLNC